GAVRSVDSQRGPGCFLAHLYHAMTPAQLDVRIGLALFVKIALAIVLLQVDEGRAPMPCFRQQVKPPDFLVAEEDPSDVPGNTLANHALAHAQAVPDVQCTLGKANGA